MANSSSRGGTKVLWVVVHTAEGIRKASDLKLFFERSTDSSAHAVADDSTLLDALVPYDRAAWTLRNGNSRSDNLELCGFAKWTREVWLNEHRGMLANAALWIRRRCQARGIPIVKLSPADVRAGKSGVIGHVDYTQGTGDGTHWDPGPGFPWDIVIKAARGEGTQEEDDMTPEQSKKLDELWSYLLPGIAKRKPSGVMADYIRRGMVAAERISGELDETEARVLAAIKADASELDVDEVAEALRERLGDSLAESLGRKLLGQQNPGPVNQ